MRLIPKEPVLWKHNPRAFWMMERLLIMISRVLGLFNDDGDRPQVKDLRAGAKRSRSNDLHNCNSDSNCLSINEKSPYKTSLQGTGDGKVETKEKPAPTTILRRQRKLSGGNELGRMSRFQSTIREKIG